MGSAWLALGAGFVCALVISVFLPGLIVLAAVAALTRVYRKILRPSVLSWEEISEFDAELGWKNKGNLDGLAEADDVFSFTTDPEGWRGKDGRIDDSEVVVFGDSHAFGHGIDEPFHFAFLGNGVRIKAVGSSGYNGVQQFLAMRGLSERLQGKLVVWLQFLGNDLLDNLEATMGRYRTPFLRVRNGQWEVVGEHVESEPWPYLPKRYKEANYDRLIKVLTPGFTADRAFCGCEYLLSEGAKLCRAVGARLAVVTVPDPLMLTTEGVDVLCKHGAKRELLDLLLPDRAIAAACSRLGIPFQAGSTFLEASDYKEHDDHWNRHGHAKLAAAVAKLHQELGPGVEMPEAICAS